MKTVLDPVKVQVFGEEYFLVTDEGPTSVTALAERLDALMHEISLKIESKDVRLVAVLAALKLMHQIREIELSLQDQKREESKLLDIITRELAAL